MRISDWSSDVCSSDLHDRAVIFAQHLEPRADVVRVADRRDDAERSAAEGRVHLGYEFLERVLLRAESAGQIPVQPAVVAAGVPHLVQARAIPVDRLATGLRRRAHPLAGPGGVDGAVAAATEVEPR